MKLPGIFQIDLHGWLLAIIVGAWLAGILLGSLLLLPPSILLLGMSLALACLPLFWSSQHSRLIVLLLACALLGAWRYTIATPANDPQAISTFISSRTLMVRGSVSDEPTIQGRSRVLLIAVASISANADATWQMAHGTLQIQTLGTVMEDPYGANYGDDVELEGKLQPPPPHHSASVFASMTFPRLHVTGSGGNPLITLLYHLRVMLENILVQALPQPQAALLIAILLGLRTPALAPLTAAFNVTGTAHLIVPSGFKVTLLAGLVAGSTRWLVPKRPPDAMRPLYLDWKRWLTTAMILNTIAIYTVLSGAGPAALRAGAMGSLMVVAPRLGRIYNVYTALAFTALTMSIIDPFIIWDTGFLLSFLGTLGIIILTPHFQRLLHALERFPGSQYLIEIIAITLAAQIATLPIFAIAFQQISFIAPIANTLTVPLLGLLLMLGLLICGIGLCMLPLALICGWLAWPLLWYMTSIIPWCANLPGAYISISALDSHLAWGYYGLLLLAVIYLQHSSLDHAVPRPQTPSTFPPISPRHWRLARLSAASLVIVTMGTMAITTQTQIPLTVTFLAVGPPGKPAQGEAILMRTSDHKTILIDGGLDSTSLSQELDSRLPPWQRTLDAVLLTAPLRDHLTGLQDIVSRYQIGTVIDGGMLHPDATYALWRRTITEHHLRYISVVQGTTIAIGGEVTLQVIWPASPLHKGKAEIRDNALIVKVIVPGLRILLLGAAGQSAYALEGLLADTDMNHQPAEIVQMIGGTVPPNLGAVLEAIRPALLIITPAALNAQENKRAQPSTVVPTAPLESRDGRWQIVQTAQVGSIEISSSARGWNMSTI